MGITSTYEQLDSGTPDGSQICRLTTHKTAFHGATPCDQAGATEDLGTVLSDKGLRAAGTAYPITTSGAVAISGSFTQSAAATFSAGASFTTSNITITDIDIALSATTGTKIGTAVTQKLGLFNVTPVVQPSGASQAAVTAGSPAATTCTILQSTISMVEACKTLVNALRTADVALGVCKGSA